MPPTASRRPLALVVAVCGASLVGIALVALAIASLVAGHGSFSGGVGLALVVYGALMLVAAWALWRRSVFGRGPVLALSLLNVAAFYSLTESAPWVWLGVAVSAVTVVAAALPSTSRALRGRRDPDALTPGDEPPPTDDRGK